MAQTTKLVSSISFNSEKFLKGKLRELVTQGVLEYGYAIFHQPEEDEKKEHWHIVVKPNRRLDTSALRNLFIETIAGEDKPLGVLPFRPTNRISDWILYSVHDTAYLIRKGEVRKHSYSKVDFFATEPDLFDEDWNDCHRSEDNKLELLKEYASRGLDWCAVIELGVIPPNLYFAYRDMFNALKDKQTFRNGRTGHDETAF